MRYSFPEILDPSRTDEARKRLEAYFNEDLRERLALLRDTASIPDRETPLLRIFDIIAWMEPRNLSA